MVKKTQVLKIKYSVKKRDQKSFIQNINHKILTNLKIIKVIAFAGIGNPGEFF